MRSPLVTGASEGIGTAFARQLAKAGFPITAVARNESRLQELLAELGTGNPDYILAALTNQKDGAILTNRISSQHFDLVVNNAGIGIYGAFPESDVHQLKNMLQLNCTSLLEISHAYLKTAQSGDALINVSSTASKL